MVRRYILLLATHRPLQRIGCPSAEYIGPIPAQILCDPHCQKKIGARQSSPPTAHPLLALITLASKKKTNPQSLSASSAQAPAAATSHRGLEVAPPAAKRYPIPRQSARPPPPGPRRPPPAAPAACRPTPAEQERHAPHGQKRRGLAASRNRSVAPLPARAASLSPPPPPAACLASAAAAGLLPGLCRPPAALRSASLTSAPPSRRRPQLRPVTSAQFFPSATPNDAVSR